MVSSSAERVAVTSGWFWNIHLPLKEVPFTYAIPCQFPSPCTSNPLESPAMTVPVMESTLNFWGWVSLSTVGGPHGSQP